MVRIHNSKRTRSTLAERFAGGLMDQMSGFVFVSALSGDVHFAMGRVST